MRPMLGSTGQPPAECPVQNPGRGWGTSAERTQMLCPCVHSGARAGAGDPWPPRRRLQDPHVLITAVSHLGRPQSPSWRCTGWQQRFPEPAAASGAGLPPAGAAPRLLGEGLQPAASPGGPRWTQGGRPSAPRRPALAELCPLPQGPAPRGRTAVDAPWQHPKVSLGAPGHTAACSSTMRRPPSAGLQVTGHCLVHPNTLPLT